MIAIASALEYLPKRKGPIKLRTDCDYACDGETLARSKLAQFDQDLLLQEPKAVQRFFRALYRHDDVELIKVRSHGDGQNNDEVHKAARDVARTAAASAGVPLRDFFGYPPPQPVFAQMAGV